MSPARDYDRTFALYEETTAGSWVYKFETDLGGDVDWHSTGVDDRSFFRVVGGRVQVIFFDEDAPEEDRKKLDAFVREMPLLTTDEEFGDLKVWIGRDDAGWFLRDYRWETDGPLVGHVPELTHEHVRAVLVRLNDEKSDAV